MNRNYSLAKTKLIDAATESADMSHIHTRTCRLIWSINQLFTLNSVVYHPLISPQPAVNLFACWCWGREGSCVLQSCFVFCFLFLSTNCIWCCYSWFMENALEENCCNDRKPLGNGSCNSFPWEFTGIFKGCCVLGSLKSFLDGEPCSH